RKPVRPVSASRPPAPRYALSIAGVAGSMPPGGAWGPGAPWSPSQPDAADAAAITNVKIVVLGIMASRAPDTDRGGPCGEIDRGDRPSIRLRICGGGGSGSDRARSAPHG